MKRITLTLAAIVVGLVAVSRIDSPVQALAVPTEIIGVPESESCECNPCLCEDCQCAPQLAPTTVPVSMVQVCEDGVCSLQPASAVGSDAAASSVSSCEDCGPVRRVVSRVRERQPVRTVLRRVFGRR